MQRLIVLILILKAIPSVSQDYRAEIHVGGIALDKGYMEDFAESHSFQYSFDYAVNAELHYCINKYFTAGATYFRSFHSELEYWPTEGPAEFHLYGDVQGFGLVGTVGTNSTRKARAYLALRGYWYEEGYHVDEYEFSLGNSGLIVTGGVGFIFRVSRNIEFKLLEVNFSKLGADFNYFNDNRVWFVSLQSAFIVKVKRRK